MLMQRRALALLAAVGWLAIFSGCERPTAPKVKPNLQQAKAIRTAFAGDNSVTPPPTDTLPTPDGWATLEGTIKISGNAPALAPLAVGGDDAAICAPGGNGPPNESLVVGEDGGIANVLIYLTSDIKLDDPAWIHAETYDPTKDAEVVFDQKQCIFLSHVFALRSSQKMKIVNSDGIGHNTKLLPKNKCAPFDQLLVGGANVVHAVLGEEKAPFPVVCNVHPWMKAYMITRDNPYFAVTDKNGKFKMPFVPASATGLELEFTIWQESAGFLKTIRVNGSNQSLKRGRYKLTLKAGEDQNLNMEIDASAFKLN